MAVLLCSIRFKLSMRTTGDKKRNRERNGLLFGHRKASPHGWVDNNKIGPRLLDKDFWLMASMKTCKRLVALLLLAGCTHFAVEDCPSGSVLGVDTVRIRSSHYRMALADPGEAAARFLPMALLSAYAYRDDDDCASAGANPLSDDAAARLLAKIESLHLPAERWQRQYDVEPLAGCEDQFGLMFHVWRRFIDSQEEFALVFRGTSGAGDWLYGNLWWFTRFAFADNQYSRARAYSGEIIEKVQAAAAQEGRPPPKIYVAGHSLGGGLAQHILYSFPDDVIQAIVFDPSSVTAFADLELEQQVAGCSCLPELGVEARIIRVYESYEILANLRIFHKIIFRPHRHIQEVRFPLDHSWNPVSAHGMHELADGLFGLAGKRVGSSLPWYASSDQICTSRFEEAQYSSCSVAWQPGKLVCPQ